MDSFRGLICHNGQFYTVDQHNGNHDLLVKVAFFDYQFPNLINQVSANHDPLEDWWDSIEMLNNFLCITFNKNDPEIYMSESYMNGAPEEYMQGDHILYDHYYQLCKKIFGKEFIPEAVTTNYD